LFVLFISPPAGVALLWGAAPRRGKIEGVIPSLLSFDSSCASLTRASMRQFSGFISTMDCRVNPGKNDERLDYFAISVSSEILEVVRVSLL